jgi:hypothetical protein
MRGCVRRRNDQSTSLRDDGKQHREGFNVTCAAKRDANTYSARQYM